ncbi:MAG TPA: PEP-CTERM sorting domain-containing protein [Nostocaceae cyanobacterium]|nr:PEP-CTERM sorting domain-containing protein [Nostocaceae cyanobacterium]
MPKNLKNHFQIAALVVLTTSVAPSLTQPAFAQNVSWTDWTSATTGLNGSATGSLSLPNQSPITVTYRGEVLFAQTNGGINYWNPATPYVSPTVPNAPPASDIIALVGGNQRVNTITFSSPVKDPVFGIVSMGQFGIPVRYNFDAPFDVLSFGPGYWGNGPLTELPGNILQGREGHGVIQFQGTLSSISWTTPVAENWHGFTVGAKKSVPEPTTALGLLFLGGLGAVGLKRKEQNFSSNDQV